MEERESNHRHISERQWNKKNSTGRWWIWYQFNYKSSFRRERLQSWFIYWCFSGLTKF